jgi:hypothetical protein
MQSVVHARNLHTSKQGRIAKFDRSHGAIRCAGDGWGRDQARDHQARWIERGDFFAHIGVIEPFFEQRKVFGFSEFEEDLEGSGDVSWLDWVDWVDWLVRLAGGVRIFGGWFFVGIVGQEHAFGQASDGREVGFDHDLQGGRLFVASVDRSCPLFHHGLDGAFGLRVAKALVVGGSQENPQGHGADFGILVPLGGTRAVKKGQSIGFVPFSPSDLRVLDAAEDFTAPFGSELGVLERLFDEFCVAFVELEEQAFRTAARAGDTSKARPAVQSVVVEDIRVAKKTADDLLLPFGFELCDDARETDGDFRIRRSIEELLEGVQLVGRKLAEFPRGTIADFEAAVAEFLDPLPQGVSIGVEPWLGVLALCPE